MLTASRGANAEAHHHKNSRRDLIILGHSRWEGKDISVIKDLGVGGGVCVSVDEWRCGGMWL